jgi:hypothetical protein
MDAGAAGTARHSVSVATFAHLHLLVGGQGHLVATTNFAHKGRVAVRQIRVRAESFAPGALEQHANPGLRDALLFSFIAAAGHKRSSRALYIRPEGPPDCASCAKSLGPLLPLP